MINLSSFPNFIKQTRKQVLDEAKVQAFKYRCYTKEDIDAFNAVNLICFCVFIAEDSLSYKVNRLVLRSHPHIIVYPEGFYDSSDQRYYTTINGLTRFFGFNFRQACYLIQSYYNGEVILHIDEYVKFKYPLAYESSLYLDFNLNYILNDNLVDKSDNNSLKMVFAVLHNRLCIDREVIQKFLHSRKLVVNKKIDLCFLEYKDDNVIAITSYRQSQNHIDRYLSTVKLGTTFTWDENSSCYYYNLYVFDDVYELMSYLSLIKKGIVPPLEKNNIMIALNGRGSWALNSFLFEHQEVKAIYSCLSDAEKPNEIIANVNAKNIVNMKTHLVDSANKKKAFKAWSEMLQAVSKEQP